MWRRLSFMSKSTINEDYFSVWSDNMAYILGFILADGNVYKNRLSIAIHQKDVEILTFIHKELNCSTNLCFYDTKTTPAVRLEISSKILIDDLKALGVESNKTFRLKLPIGLPDKYFYHFVRGFFDGDGSVSLKRGKELHSNICSVNLHLLEDIRIRCNSLGHIYESKTSKGNPVYYWVMSQSDSWKFRDLIYSDNSFALQRKRAIFFRKESKICGCGWRPWELEFLCKNVLSKSKKEISISLGRSYNAVRFKLKDLKLT